MALRQQVVEISGESDVMRATLATRDMAEAAGLRPARSSAMMTAVSELARNILKYATRGCVELSVVQQGPRQGVQAIVSDQGPGIVSIERAMQDRFSTSNTLGLGLPGTRRLVDDFEIESEVGRGTRVLIRIWS